MWAAPTRATVIFCSLWAQAEDKLAIPAAANPVVRKKSRRVTSGFIARSQIRMSLNPKF